MSKIKILFSEDNELSEMEAVKCHGHRVDVIVVIDGKVYHPEFFTPNRMSLDSQQLDSLNKDYFQKFNVIIVKQVDKQTIINTILDLSKTSYFSYFSPYDNKMLKERGFEDWESFVQVYPR